MITVCVTAVGGGVGQSVLRALSHSHLAMRIIGTDVRALSAGLFWVDSAFLVPSVMDETAYVARLLEICRRERVDVLIPGSDPELEPLARHRTCFLQQGCTPVTGSLESILFCRDKHLLGEFCQARGLPFVETFTLEEARAQINRLSFPLIIKPRGGSGSVGARLALNKEDLQSIQPTPDLIVQRYLLPSTSSAPLSMPAEQGRLDQSNEHSLQFYVATDGEVLGCFGSINRLKDGVPIEVMPAPDSPALTDGRRIVQALASMGLRGPVNVQGRMTSEGARFFEVNPRFTGITGVRAAMGYREVEAAIWDQKFGRLDEARRCLSYRPGTIGLRYVDESLVSVRRVADLTERRETTSAEPGSLPARVLVTGASGYVGLNLIARLLTLSDVEEVRAGVRSKEAGKHLAALFGDTPRLVPVEGELPHSPWAMDGVQTVVHAAAIRPTRAQPVQAEAFLRVNAEGTRRLIAAMRGTSVERLIYLSSQAVYGTASEPPWSEMQPPLPETTYGLSKWIGEQVCVHHFSGPAQVVIVRCARVYGWGYACRWSEFPHRFAWQAARSEPLNVHGDGRQRMDLLHIGDLCDAIISACTAPLQESARLVLNIGSGAPLSVAELASLCCTIAVESEIGKPSIRFRQDAPNTERNFGMEIRRARDHLNWRPSTSLQSGFKELIDVAAKLTSEEHLA